LSPAESEAFDWLALPFQRALRRKVPPGPPTLAGRGSRISAHPTRRASRRPAKPKFHCHRQTQGGRRVRAPKAVTVHAVDELEGFDAEAVPDDRVGLVGTGWLSRPQATPVPQCWSARCRQDNRPACSGSSIPTPDSGDRRSAVMPSVLRAPSTGGKHDLC